jgi:DNA helicase-2/ATP-dependent DNA helicase PcrA
MKEAVADCGFNTSDFPPARMLDAVSALKNRLIGVEVFADEAEGFFSKTLAKVYARYQHILDERNGLDFDDLLMKAARLFKNCPDVCSQLCERFRFLLIDEYQDTNHAQYQIAKLLVSEHNNICVTGDPDQSIYRWRGADIRNILDFEGDWPGATVVKLEENFRSSANILTMADRLIAFNRNRKQKVLIPTRPAGKEVVVEVYEDEQKEAEAVARQVKRIVREGTSPRDIAVFYRVNAASRILEEAFIKNKVPYQIVRGVEFYSRKEIRDVLAYLRALVNPADEIALLRIINTPARGIGKTTIDRVRSHAALRKMSFFDALKRPEDIQSLSKGTKANIKVFVNMAEQFKEGLAGKVAPLVERIFIESGLEEALRAEGAKGKEAIENVEELINAAQVYDEQNEEPTVVDYLQQISLFSDADSYDSTVERAALMTLHSAKGLEFENVFIAGLENGLLPHARTDIEDEDDLEEERRLFFVGMTRAKSGLYISYARYRTIRGQLLRTIPSQFLYELGVDLTQKTHTGQYDSDDAEQEDNADNAECFEWGFVKGELVCHDIFGYGRVKEFIDMGENSMVVVRFNTGHTKSLMLKYAGLTKVE